MKFLLSLSQNDKLSLIEVRINIYFLTFCLQNIRLINKALNCEVEGFIALFRIQQEKLTQSSFCKSFKFQNLLHFSKEIYTKSDLIIAWIFH